MNKASVVVFCTLKEEFILFPRKGTFLLESPGGKLESNETFLECAIREIYEEVNIVLTKNDLIFFDTMVYKKPTETTIIHTYLCLNKEPSGTKISYSALQNYPLAFKEDITGLYLDIINFLKQCSV